MLEALNTRFLHLLINKQILLDNPTGALLVDLLRIAALVLLTTFAVRLIFNAILFIRLRRRYEPYTLREHPEIVHTLMGIADSLDLRAIPRLYTFSNEQPLIFTIGVFNPAVFLSPKLAERLSGEELRSVLAHELTHIKRRDPLVFWLFDLAVALIPGAALLLYGGMLAFNPDKGIVIAVAAVLTVLFCRETLREKLVYLRELSCDDHTLRVIREPLALAAALVKVWQYGRLLPRFNWRYAVVGAHPFLAATGRIAPRVERLIDYRPSPRRFLAGRTMRYTSAVVILAVSGLFMNFYLNYDGAMILFSKDRELNIFMKGNTPGIIYEGDGPRTMKEKDLDIVILESESEDGTVKKELRLKKYKGP